MRLSTFRAIFEGLLAIDVFASGRFEGQSDSIRHSWQTLLIEVTHRRVTGQELDNSSYASLVCELSRQDTAAYLLGILPIVLLNVDRFGHRQTSLCQWARSLGLSEDAIVPLRELFLYLCQIEAAETVAPNVYGHSPGSNLRLESPFSNATLGSAYRMLQESQGQFWLSLKLARSQGWSEAQMGILALFFAVQGGIETIPVVLRTSHSMSQSMKQNSGFYTTDPQPLLQLSTGLYRCWCGTQGQVSLMLQDSVPVTI